MTVPELKLLWSHALDTADAAIVAGSRAGTLPPEFCAHELERVRRERRWLAQLERL